MKARRKLREELRKKDLSVESIIPCESEEEVGEIKCQRARRNFDKRWTKKDFSVESIIPCESGEDVEEGEECLCKHKKWKVT